MQKTLSPYRSSDHLGDIFFIINPEAGTGRFSGIIRSIKERFKPGSYEIHRVSGKDRIDHIVQDALSRGYKAFAAVGGDGTVSGVGGALAQTDAVLGIIPAGTANMMAREMHIPMLYSQALRLISGDHEIATIDSMEARGTHYIYQISFGFSSLMNSLMAQGFKRGLGRSIYIISGISRLLELKSSYYILEVDANIGEFEATQVIVANAGVLGLNPFRLGRGIRPDDGRLDVFVMEGRNASISWPRGREWSLEREGTFRPFPAWPPREAFR